MHILKRILLVLMVVVFFVIGLVFYLHNPTAVKLDFVWFNLPAMSIAIYLSVTLLIGVLLGALPNYVLLLNARRRLCAMSSELDGYVSGE